MYVYVTNISKEKEEKSVVTTIGELCKYMKIRTREINKKKKT